MKEYLVLLLNIEIKESLAEWSARQEVAIKSKDFIVFIVGLDNYNKIQIDNNNGKQ